MFYSEEKYYHYSTDKEWDDAEARELGFSHPDQAWILTDRDVWHANPFYKGPVVPSPYDEELQAEAEEYEAYLSTLSKADRDDLVLGTDYGPIYEEDCPF